MRPSWFISLLLCVLMLSGCRAIRRTVDSRQSIEARRLSREGLAAMHQDRWDEAEALFQSALELSHSDDRAYLRDAAGTFRLLARRVDFASMVELAFNQIRHYGCGDVLVDIRMIDALTEIAGVTNDPQRLALLWRHVGMVSRNADRKLDEPHDRELLNACLVHAGAQMGYEASTLLLHPNV